MPDARFVFVRVRDLYGVPNAVHFLSNFSFSRLCCNKGLVLRPLRTAIIAVTKVFTIVVARER